MIVIRHKKCKDVILLRVNSPTLEGMDLSEAYLPGAHMVRLRCNRVQFRETCLRTADLRGASLRGADLTNANLREADLRGADLQDACLAGAVLTRALSGSRTR